MTEQTLLEHLTELEQKATPGPWKVRVKGNRVWGIVVPASLQEPLDVVIVETDSGYYPPRMPEARFIAVARNAMPDLLALARAAGEVVRAERERISGQDRDEAHQALVVAWKRVGGG